LKDERDNLKEQLYQRTNELDDALQNLQFANEQIDKLNDELERLRNDHQNE
jgi:hypothetical protein